MPRIHLRHLTFIGTSVQPASVEFGDGLTLIRGPSDTGKSFIVDAIDFMMGATSLKEIPERLGYSTVLLGLSLPSGDVVTLARSVTGGAFSVYQEDVRSGPLSVPDMTLSPKHAAGSEKNISRFLLSAVGLDGSLVRKNIKNETNSLSFRDLAHLCIVDETQMQSTTPPALSGQYVSRTKEISVLKLLLQDEDDSNLVPTPDTSDTKRTARAKAEVIDGLLADLWQELADVGDELEIRERLDDLNEEIEGHTDSIEDLTSRRSDVILQRSLLQDEISAKARQATEATALLARFSLLLTQYNSDLERLEMISEAGSLLGYFDRRNCVFCGAQVEHQHLNENLAEGTHFGESVAAETTKTTALRSDLLATMADLETERASLSAEVDSARERLAIVDTELTQVDAELSPYRQGLSQVLQRRRVFETALAKYEQIADLDRRKADLGDESKAEATTVAVAALNLSVLTEFSAEIRARLEAWRVPGSADVRYDRGEQDLIAGDQLRAAHGKGVRAILHAAFTAALCQYCMHREIDHPGFVILDSPLVTYRAPDEEGSAAVIEAGVADAFYSDLQLEFGGQIIVMENTDPANPLEPGTVDVQFTKSTSAGRYGFFPPSNGSAH